jgi:oligopeptide transport system permease protein
MAYRVRTQFYRFKNQEYVLAARTLGAGLCADIQAYLPQRSRNDNHHRRFDNTRLIFTESTLSYLGIVNFNGALQTSLGTMLANGQGYLATDPHIILFLP